MVKTTRTRTPLPRQAAPSAAYAQAAAACWPGARIWDYLRYDGEGYLWVNDLRIVDAIRRYGTPLEIVDTTILERRAGEWQRLAAAVAREVGYSGRLQYLYAAKANMASEITCAAYRSGWHAETSSQQDLNNLQWLRQHDLLPKDLRVVCNGFKLPPASLGWPWPEESELVAAGHHLASRVDLPEVRNMPRQREAPYAEMIARMARQGWDITPILDQGELDFFAAPGMPELKVGLRLKFGPVRTFADLDALVSRFGLDRHALAAAAGAIDRAPHLTFTTLHAMVGAAETIPPEHFVESLLLGVRIWADLRRRHETLVELNMGGGVPPLSDPYDHAGFLRAFLGGLIPICAAAGVPVPNVTFEFGSLLAAEAGFHVFKVVAEKLNHGAVEGEPASWAIVNGGLMAAIPDMLLIGKEFRILAAEHAKEPARRVRLGDVTCDSDGRYPPKHFGPHAAILLPQTDGELHVVIQGVGAYQELLAGVRGAHHCGLLEAVELILERHADGGVVGRLMPRQTHREAAALLGYDEAAVPALRAALRRMEDGGRA